MRRGDRSQGASDRVIGRHYLPGKESMTVTDLRHHLASALDEIQAGRTKDTNDIIWLLGELGITEYADAERIFEDHYPGDVLKPAAEQRLAYAIEPVNLRLGSSPDGLDRTAPRDPRDLPKPLPATSGPTLSELLGEARGDER